jgi:hypothetical protein
MDGRHNISAATELENPDARLHAFVAWHSGRAGTLQTRARARGKNSLRRSVSDGNRHAPFGTPRIDDSTHAVKGFWDWSR